jgi:hypothetical protein
LAAENGHIHVLEWAVSNDLERLSLDAPDALLITCHAANVDHIAVLDWVKDRGMWTATSNYIGVRLTCKAAKNTGRLQVLDWLWDNHFRHGLIKCAAVYAAVQQGFIRVIECMGKRSRVRFHGGE